MGELLLAEWGNQGYLSSSIHDSSVTYFFNLTSRIILIVLYKVIN